MLIRAFGKPKFPKQWESPWQRYGLAIGSFAASLLLRFALHRLYLPPNAGYMLFIPAIVLTTLFAGYRAGLVTASLSLLTVWYLFLSSYQSFAASLAQAVGEVATTGTMMAFIEWVRVVVSQLEATSQREKVLINELQHRHNNLFAVIHGLAARTLDPSEAQQAFLGRLAALGRADHRLMNSASKGTTLHYLIHSELDPFAGRFNTDGDDIFLDSQTARNFSIVLHELATNASKYGAFSTNIGKVWVSWTLSGDQRLRFIWKESGGPPVELPKRKGFGTTLMKSAFVPARLEYLPGGVRYEADVKLGSLLSGGVNEQPVGRLT